MIGVSGAHPCRHCDRGGRLAGKAVLTPAEAATLLGRSKSWTIDKLEAGLLPGIRDGSRWLVRRGDLVREGWLPADDGYAPSEVGP